MFVLSNLLQAIAQVLDSLLSIYFWVVIISAVLSWVNPDPYNTIVRVLRAVTEPVFYRIRRWLPFTYMSGIDFSPLIVLLAIQFIKVFLVRSLYQVAIGLG